MADQSTTFIADPVHPCRVASILVLLLVVASENGCSTARPSIKSLWQQVPPVRWSSKDSQSQAAKKENVAEPAVAANVAIKSNDSGKTDVAEGITATETRTKPQQSRLTTRVSRPEHASNDSQSTFETVDFSEPNTQPLNSDGERTGPDSPLERLNAALSDDALQAQSLPQRSVTMLEERFRVDSLLSRAGRLIEIGQLQQAKEAALLAQELGDAAQLDYSPDEDRPIDLIRRIDGQLEAIRLADQPAPKEDNEPENAVATEAPSSDDVAVPSNSPEKELKVLTRKNRNWSAFFRREKKTSAPSAEPGRHAPETLTLGTPASVRDDSQSVARSAGTVRRDAVVMANRSVSLANAEPANERESTAFPDSDDQKTSVEDPFAGTIPNSTGLENSRVRSDRAVSFAVSSDSSRTTSEPDEGTGAFPEVDAVETLIPTHEVETETDNEPTRPSRSDSTESIRPADGTLFYLTMAACTVLALIYYRRGAT